MQVFTTTGTDFKIVVMILGVLSATGAHWRTSAQRVWSFAVYYLGYRVLSVQLSCGSWAVSGAPLVMKYVAA